MGDRGQVEIVFPGDQGSIYLYSHWGGHGLPSRLSAALNQSRSRWDDEPYLARILISRIVTDHNDLIGHGIAPYSMESEYPDLTVRLENKFVYVAGQAFSFEDFADLGIGGWETVNALWSGRDEDDEDW